MERLIGITDLRNQAKELIDSLGDGPVIILRRNQPVAMLIHPDEVQKLLDRIDELEGNRPSH